MTHAIFPKDFDSNYNTGDSSDDFPEVFNKAYDFWGAKTNSICEENLLKKGKHPGACFLLSVIDPYITSCTRGLCLENLVQSSTIDSSFLGSTNMEEKSKEKWRQAILREFEAFDWIFSGGDQSYHTLLKGKKLWRYGPRNGLTFGDVLNSYWNNESPKQIIFGNK